jgi:hypothetical protein
MRKYRNPFIIYLSFSSSSSFHLASFHYSNPLHSVLCFDIQCTTPLLITPFTRSLGAGLGFFFSHHPSPCFALIHPHIHIIPLLPTPLHSQHRRVSSSGARAWGAPPPTLFHLLPIHHQSIKDEVGGLRRRRRRGGREERGRRVSVRHQQRGECA